MQTFSSDPFPAHYFLFIYPPPASHPFSPSFSTAISAPHLATRSWREVIKKKHKSNTQYSFFFFQFCWRVLRVIILEILSEWNDGIMICIFFCILYLWWGLSVCVCDIVPTCRAQEIKKNNTFKWRKGEVIRSRRKSVKKIRQRMKNQGTKRRQLETSKKR